MILTLRWVLIGTCLLNLACAAAAEPLSAEQNMFVDRYVDAIRANDVARLKMLVHPKSLACITPESADFFNDVLARRARYTSVHSYQASARPIAPGEALFMEENVTYPARPTHWIQIELNLGPTSRATLMVQVLAEGGIWRELVPCPTAAALAKYREAKAQARSADQRARVLSAKLSDPLRSELRQLLSQGRKVEAITRYNAETGENLGIAKRVIELLRAEK